MRDQRNWGADCMANRKVPTETSRYKFNPGDVKADRSLREDRGWLKMDVRWVVTENSAGSEVTVIGRTILPPGVGAMHAIHRHPNAEEWEYVIHGTGIKHVGEESFYVRPGDVAFIPRNVYHGLENASDNEPLITIWGYSGAPSLEKAGYVIPEDEGEPAVKLSKANAAKWKPRKKGA
jgi:quercetin dioxygenase-like cupin family protein